MPESIQVSGGRLALLAPLVVATSVTPVLYYQQFLLLFTKVSEVFTGVFDTSVPAYPLAGMLFVLVFAFLRRQEFLSYLANKRRDLSITIASVGLAVIPLLVAVGSRNLIADNYSFSGVALVCAWVGIAVAMRPTLSNFLYPYLLVYLAAVGSVGVLTSAFGDPLAVVVANISNAITNLIHQPVEWSSINIHFVASGGTPISLYISEECSGIASISIFLLLIGLMHLDVRPKIRRSLIYAAVGSLLFIFLNSLRVVAVIWGGIAGGPELMWSLHGWVGYALYILGYGVIALFYLRSQKENLRSAQSH